MALWHFINSNGDGMSWDEKGVQVSSFDDGLEFLPDEQGFSRDAADAKAKQLGGTAEYTGTPNWHSRIEREEARAAADAEIDALLNPADPTDAQKAVINARYDALLAAAPDRKADIEKLRKADIKAV